MITIYFLYHMRKAYLMLYDSLLFLFIVFCSEKSNGVLEAAMLVITARVRGGMQAEQWEISRTLLYLICGIGVPALFTFMQVIKAVEEGCTACQAPWTALLLFTN